MSTICRSGLCKMPASALRRHRRYNIGQIPDPPYSTLFFVNENVYNNHDLN